jgi:hypothetical protein
MFGWFRKPRIGDVQGLVAWIAGEAAFIAQSSLNGYLRAKTGMAYFQLMSEQSFRDAYEIARWEGYSALAADLLVVVEGQLRRHSQTPSALVDGLAACFAQVLTREPVPAHRAGTGWTDVTGPYPARLARCQMAAPLAPDTVARTAAAVVFDSLPIHPNHRRGDEEAVFGAIRFNMLAAAARAETRLDQVKLAAGIARASTG